MPWMYPKNNLEFSYSVLTTIWGVYYEKLKEKKKNADKERKAENATSSKNVLSVQSQSRSI